MVFDPALHTMVAVTIIPVALVIRATASADIRGRSSIFGSRAMVRLGNLSFAFYVLHVIVLMNVARLFTGVTDWSFVSVVGVLLLSFVITIALSAVLHFGVEQPLYRRFANPRRDKEPTPSADLGQSAGDRA
jgi:peptidoglycan/LPS O-acetylase OafA/YrhL